MTAPSTRAARALAEARRLSHFAWSDLQTHFLAALREQAMRRVEDLAARRRDRPLDDLLPLGALSPIPSVDELHVRRLDENRERENREQRVRETNAPRANHEAAVESQQVVGESPAVRASECACSDRCSAIGCSRARLDASRMALSSFVRSASRASRCPLQLENPPLPVDAAHAPSNDARRHHHETDQHEARSAIAGRRRAGLRDASPCPEARTTRARVAGHLVFRRGHRSSRQRGPEGASAAGAHRLLGRTDACRAPFAERVLHDAILARVVRDDDEAFLPG